MMPNTTQQQRVTREKERPALQNLHRMAKHTAYLGWAWRSTTLIEIMRISMLAAILTPCCIVHGTQVEKYRPSLIKDIVGNTDAVSRLQIISEEGNMPHFILSVRRLWAAYRLLWQRRGAHFQQGLVEHAALLLHSTPSTGGAMHAKWKLWALFRPFSMTYLK